MGYNGGSEAWVAATVRHIEFDYMVKIDIYTVANVFENERKIRNLSPVWEGQNFQDNTSVGVWKIIVYNKTSHRSLHRFEL